MSGDRIVPLPEGAFRATIDAVVRPNLDSTWCAWCVEFPGFSLPMSGEFMKDKLGITPPPPPWEDPTGSGLTENEARRLIGELGWAGAPTWAQKLCAALRESLEGRS